MLNQQFVDAMYHLAKIVTEYQATVLEAIITEDTVVVHLIPVELYQALNDEEEEEDDE